jgi:hypothetical protein
MKNNWEYDFEWLHYRKWKSEWIVKNWWTIIKSINKNGSIIYILYLYNDTKNYFSRTCVNDFVEVSEWKFIIDWFKITIQELEKFIDNEKDTRIFYIEKWKLIYHNF